ncbi:MAG: BatA domain-containing protein [Phycisphaerae bacterium]
MAFVSFVHPGIAAATGALALLPVLIHLINRRRYRREPWAAMMFLLKAHRRSRRRIRLQHWLLLALRTLVILAVGLSIARPRFSQASLPPFLAEKRVDRVLILDDSLSMQARGRETGRVFDAARRVAREILDRAGPGHGIGIVTASYPPQARTDRPLHNPGQIRRIVDALQCGSRVTDLEGALEQASRLLARGEAAPGGREVYVLTDLASSPRSVDPRDSHRTEEPTTQSRVPALEDSRPRGFSTIDRLFFVNVGPRDRANLAITHLRVTSQVIGTGVPLRIAFDIANHSDQLVENVQVHLKLDGTAVRTLDMPSIRARETVSRSVDLSITTAGSHHLSASLVAPPTDALTLDNTCHLAVRVDAAIPVLLVEGDLVSVAPGRRWDRAEAALPPSRRSLFYYRAALSVAREGQTQPSFRLKTIAPAALDTEVLRDYRVIVLGDVPRLSAGAWAALGRYVREGGGLVAFLGEGVDPRGYRGSITRGGFRRSPLRKGQPNEGDSAAGPLPVEPDVFARLEMPDEKLRFSMAQPDHPVFRDFAGYESGGLLSAFVHGYWRVKESQKPPVDGVQTLLRLSNGDPALLSAQLGRGRVLLWLLDANMAGSNLPAKPDYLPLMLNTTFFVLGRGEAGRNVRVGEALIHRLDPGAASRTIRVVTPDGSLSEGRVDADELGLVALFDDTESPGPYRFQSAERIDAFAVNIDPRESDLRAMSTVELKRRFGADAVLVAPGPRAVITAGARPMELGRLGMVLLLVLVLMETLAATSMGPRDA